MVSRLDMSIWDDRLAEEPSSDEQIRLASGWHRREAQLADQRGSSFAVMHHLRHIPDSQFDNDLRQIRATANARLRNWSAAAADFKTVASDVATDVRRNEMNILQRDRKTNVTQRQLTLRLYNMAAIKLLGGDEVEYRQWTRQLTQAIKTPSDALIINGVAWTWCLGAHEAADVLPIVQMVQAELSKATQSSQRNELMNTMGALLYRAGRFDEAISKLNASIDANGNGGVIEDWLFLSMANRRLGRDEDATQWLEKSRGVIENLGRHSRSRQLRRPTTNWDTVPIQQHLFREAESLAKPK
jgi:tetratricopeptide (TPR) repeat protein